MTLIDTFINRFQLTLPEPVNQPIDAKKSAAVLLPIINKPNPTILLTERASTLRSHAGQVALPGGKREPQDKSLIETALREAHEEVDIPPSMVSVIGQLAPLRSSEGYLVTPIVGVIPPNLSLRHNPTEVASVFEMPLSYVLNTQRYLPLDFRRAGKMHRIYFYPYEGHLVWGLTAAILHNLALHIT
ncbi:CoA pyrophosphatase [Proteus mirabilis]|uniref:CoA pyrophosphatase n=1 Tax=Proteus mirabilis TaxID=584 RepID=UPI002246A6ED|nr:CoA pyrophosphatase [Proteus mirabilis]MCW9739885.1 CoA pyrophosphatase [Proteus mirabilis]MDM3636791.1 CoA pyrophosphatase [Proteus mirabilis]